MEKDIIERVSNLFPGSSVFQERYPLPIPTPDLVPIGTISTTTWLDVRIDGVRVRGLPTVMNSRGTVTRRFTGNQFIAILPELVFPISEDREKEDSVLLEDGKLSAAAVRGKEMEKIIFLPPGYNQGSLYILNRAQSSVVPHMREVVRKMDERVVGVGHVVIASAEQVLSVFVSLIKEKAQVPIGVTIRTSTPSGALFYLDMTCINYEGELTVVFDENPGHMMFGSNVLPVFVEKE